jgi:hypothetical protein
VAADAQNDHRMEHDPDAGGDGQCMVWWRMYGHCDDRRHAVDGLSVWKLALRRDEVRHVMASGPTATFISAVPRPGGRAYAMPEARFQGVVGRQSTHLGTEV